jgi:EF-hand domain pair/EF hand
MIRRTAFALSVLLFSAATHADPENVRQWQSSLQFRPAVAQTSGEAGASGGTTARRPPPATEKEAMFRYLDFDGDGFVSKAEAAGNEFATLGFDRADRNRDGKLSFAEYDSIGKPQPARKKGDKSKVAKSKSPEASASAGATKKAD